MRECNVYVAFVEEKKLVYCNIFRSRKLKENKDIHSFSIFIADSKVAIRAIYREDYTLATIQCTLLLKLLKPFHGGEWIMASKALNVDNMF